MTVERVEHLRPDLCRMRGGTQSAHVAGTGDRARRRRQKVDNAIAFAPAFDRAHLTQHLETPAYFRLILAEPVSQLTAAEFGVDQQSDITFELFGTESALKSIVDPPTGGACDKGMSKPKQAQAEGRLFGRVGAFIAPRRSRRAARCRRQAREVEALERSLRLFKANPQRGAQFRSPRLRPALPRYDANAKKVQRPPPAA